MPNENTLYPALQQIAATALDAAGNAPCAVCNDENTNPYVFAYGKKVSEESKVTTQGNTTTTVTTTRYNALHARVVHLCTGCVDAHRRTMAVPLWITVIALALISLALIITVITMPGDQAALAILATLSPFVTLFFSIKLFLTLTEPDRAGRDKALRLYIKALKSEGYDSFWKDTKNPDSL